MADIGPGVRLHFVTAGESARTAEEMMREVAANVTEARIDGAAHWIAEENPEFFTRELLRFLGTA